MIKARFYVNKGALCLKVEGHAEAGPKGHDAVCAGASVLSATLADVVSIMGNHGELEKDPVIRMREGFANVKAKPTEAGRGKLLLAFSVIETGMCAIARNYPEYITVKLFDKPEIEGFSK